MHLEKRQYSGKQHCARQHMPQQAVCHKVVIS